MTHHHNPREGSPHAHRATRSAPHGVDRRALIRGSAAAALGIALAGSVDAIAGPSAAAATTRAARGYGPLVKDPAGRLSLPRGFSYRLVAQSGTTRLTDGGEPTPGDPDGTASFPRPGGFTLVNNHELSGADPHPVPQRATLSYDPGSRGGTTNIEVSQSGDRVREYVSVCGTSTNCAGGKTPWGTWLTCEETEIRAGEDGATKDHGFVFEVSPVAAENPGNSPVPLRFLGRYAHEAVAIDPDSSTIYLTEDATGPNGLYYRWTPPRGFRGGKGALKRVAQGAGGDTAGSLQAMSCFDRGRHVTDLAEATEPGTTYDVRWVDVPDRLARTTSTRSQFTADRITRSRKLEGQWWDDRKRGAYFVASFARTTDGSVRQHDGQVWFYDPRQQRIRLEVFFGLNPDPASDTDDDGPDNITVSPYGGLILAEDGEGVQHLVGVTDQGNTFPMARNETPEQNEFTGPNFSADGRLLFANIQGPGLVFAISGPWTRPSNANDTPSSSSVTPTTTSSSTSTTTSSSMTTSSSSSTTSR